MTSSQQQDVNESGGEKSNLVASGSKVTSTHRSDRIVDLRAENDPGMPSSKKTSGFP